MTRFILRRLAIILPVLLLINFLGFAYAHIARPLRAARNPSLAWLAETSPAPLLPTYGEYAKNFLHLDFGIFPTTREPLGPIILRASVNSLGLLLLGVMLSTTLGVVLGLLATHPNPPRTARWLTILATGGLATPSFYLGTLLIFLVLFNPIQGPLHQSGTLLPTSGIGWDKHLVMPLITLMLHPLVQIAQVTSGLLVEELGKQYVVTARGMGQRWSTILRKHALRNLLATVILNINGALRLMVGELILVEWLFAWPGLGSLLAKTLIPAQLSTSLGGALFLEPPIIAAIITVFAALFLVSDLIVAVLVRTIDPRLSRATSEEVVASV